ncbi:MAG: hypothetical protein V3V12_04495 [Gammaproteobacteria bacterium]
MVDGSTHVIDRDKTEVNRDAVNSFVNQVLIDGQLDALSDYIDENDYTEHNPLIIDLRFTKYFLNMRRAVITRQSTKKITVL